VLESVKTFIFMSVELAFLFSVSVEFQVQ